MNERLAKHIESKQITQQILDKVSAEAVEITTNSAELTSIMIKIIYSKIGGKMGVVFTENEMFDVCWKKHQEHEGSLIKAFAHNKNKELEVEGFRSLEDEQFETANRALINNESAIYLTSKEGLLLNTIKRPRKENDLTIEIGGKINRSALFEKLDKWGYSQSDWCSSKQTYASRGGIIDIFPTLQKNPIRVELNGLEVVSIRVFNITNQESIKKITKNVIREPVSKKTGFSDDTVEDLFSSHIDKILYITSEFGEKNTVDSNRFDLHCEKLSKNTLSKHKINKKIKEYIKTDNRVFVFKGVRVDQSLKNNVEECDHVFEENIKCQNLNTILIGTPGTTQKHRNIKIENTQQRRLTNLDDIEWGDVLVHQDYGLGVYRGLERFSGASESIKIEYLGGASVFVPIDKFDRVHKYIGPGGASPKLTRLGSGAWEKQKLTTRKSVDRVVSHLIENYKAKQKPRGFVYRGDGELIQQVEDSFPYVETRDQAQSILDVYKDMSIDKPMDRMIYGDVGFGKTEVAIRAAILAITSGRAVFFLAPTTVLSDQHFITCVNRLSPIGVKIELLSRFKSKKEQTKILEDYNKGRVDMLVGTHRLLSPDVKTDRLGLLIVDEEHRFGVKHKESIRKMKGGVDVLTLTATPIPRTLQQSLVGIRDTSKIETAPQDRLPIKTYINRFDWSDVKNKIKYEINRGGQVYFIHNEIESIPFIVDRLSVEFPDITVSGAHGQMANGPLEKIVLGFFNKKVDVLVCTTIVESGLDVKNANTIIINNAQNFGLSQLYQIRGRVGRGNRQAFCYLCIPRKVKLLPDAYERLKTMEYYTSLGSGYHVAIKDLEIRGAGNVFGYEQSGQMLQVGLELYNKILSEAISEKTNEKKRVGSDGVVVVFDQESLISPEYMPSAQDRLRFYQELVGAINTKDIDDIKKRIIDQFGVIDKSIENLFLVARIRLTLAPTPIKKCVIKESVIRFVVKKNISIKLDLLMKRLELFSNKNKNKHRFEGGVGGETNIVLENIKDANLLKTISGFAGLFSGVLID